MHYPTRYAAIRAIPGYATISEAELAARVAELDAKIESGEVRLDNYKPGRSVQWAFNERGDAL